MKQYSAPIAEQKKDKRNEYTKKKLQQLPASDEDLHFPDKTKSGMFDTRHKKSVQF